MTVGGGDASAHSRVVRRAYGWPVSQSICTRGLGFAQRLRRVFNSGGALGTRDTLPHGQRDTIVYEGELRRVWCSCRLELALTSHEADNKSVFCFDTVHRVVRDVDPFPGHCDDCHGPTPSPSLRHPTDVRQLCRPASA